MKKTKTARFASAIIALLLAAVFALASCATPEGPNGETTVPSVGTTGNAVTESQETLYDGHKAPATVDLGKYNFRVYLYNNSLWVKMHYNETGS
ncbi:MAG: hypothetical protein MJ137_06455, partial [Clostridia bacterium]|nr:hypothetical protein [Clostridia bacterium]